MERGLDLKWLVSETSFLAAPRDNRAGLAGFPPVVWGVPAEGSGGASSTKAPCPRA